MNIISNGLKIVLHDKDFITEGGEGKIYGKNNIIYKIYTNPNKVISEKKINELSVLELDNIIKPLNLIYNSKQSAIGFTMKWVNKTFPLVKLFSNSYKDINKIDIKKILKIIDNIKKIIEYIHSKNILIVDGNEFNYLIDDIDKETPYFIDVDSYQTQNFPATAIMPTILDYKSKGHFSTLSDWFSFGIVSFQLLTGIHPYKGTHPDYSKKDLEGRMRKNISVFNKNVILPSTAKSFDIIPDELKQWYYNIFEKEMRIPPPTKHGFIPQIVVSIGDIDISVKFDIKVLFEFAEEILEHQYILNCDIFKFKNIITINKKPYFLPNKDAKYIITNNFEPLFISIENNKLKIENAGNQKIQIPDIYSNGFFIINNKLFNVFEDKISFVESVYINNKMFFSISNSWDILPNSTKIFDGFAFSDLLGKYYLNIPFDLEKEKVKLSVIHIPELEGYRIIDGVRKNNVIVLVVHKDNKYNKVLLKFDKVLFNNYICQIFEDVQDIEINFTVLDTGICIFFNEEKVYIMSNSIKSSAFNIIQDIDLNKINPIISNRGTIATFYSKNKFYEFKVKQ